MSPGLGDDARGVLCGRQTEGSRILTAELGRAFVADIQRDSGDVARTSHEQLSRLQEPETLLVLQGTQGGDRLEVTVERRSAHGSPFRQRVNAQGQGEVPADPLDGMAHS